MNPSRSCRFHASCCTRSTCSMPAFAPSSLEWFIADWPLSSGTQRKKRKKQQQSTNRSRIETSGSCQATAHQFRTTFDGRTELRNDGRGELWKLCHSERSFIARGICFGTANNRFLTGKERRFGMTKRNVVRTAPPPEFSQRAAAMLKALRPALLGRDRLARNFPGPLRPVDRRFVVVLKAIVVVGVAHRSQRLVVKTGQPERNLQLLGKRLQRLQVVRSRRNFGLRILQELLVTAVDQLRDLAANQVSGIRENLHPILGRLLNRSRHIVFSKEHTPVGARRIQHIETVLAQPGQRFLVTSCFNCFRHFSPLPIALFRCNSRANCLRYPRAASDLQSVSSKDTILHSVFRSFLHITIVTGKRFQHGSQLCEIGGHFLRASCAGARRPASGAESARSHRQYAVAALRSAHGRSSRSNTFGQGRMAQPRRISEGPRRRQHRRRRPQQRPIRSRQDSARRHQRQYWYRLCYARRGSRIRRHPLHAAERFRRAKEDSRRLRREHFLYRPRRRLRRGHSPGSRTCRQAS